MEIDITFSLTAFFSLLYMFLFIWFSIGWFFTKTSKKHNTFKEKITIIVPVRNEELNISDCINTVLGQSHPNYEVIEVNDHSKDSTQEIVENAIELYPDRLRLINLKEVKGKKNAINKGIEESKGEIVVTTDADCLVGIDWLISLHSQYNTSKTKMIVAPVLIKGSFSFFSVFQQLEQLALTIVSVGSIYFNRPILCSGANLMYEKLAFVNVKGYEDILEVPTGDDILLMYKFKKKYGTNAVSYAKSVTASVETKQVTRLVDLIQQKKRWASKVRTNPHLFTIVISMITALVNLLVVLYILFAALNPHLVEKLLLLFMFKAIIDILFLSLATSFFGKTKLLLLALPLQIVVPFYTIFIGIASLIGDYKWKGRTYHHGKER